MFLWSIALQYLIYTICVLLIEHQIKKKYLFVTTILISCVLLGFMYPLFGIFTALFAIGMLMLTFFFFLLPRKNWFMLFLGDCLLRFRRPFDEHQRFFYFEICCH